MSGNTGDAEQIAKGMPWHVRASAKRWALGCVIPTSSLPLAVGGEFTQPGPHLSADPCIPSHSQFHE